MYNLKILNIDGHCSQLPKLMRQHISVVIDLHGERFESLMVEGIVTLNLCTVLNKDLHPVLLVSLARVVLACKKKKSFTKYDTSYEYEFSTWCTCHSWLVDLSIVRARPG